MRMDVDGAVREGAIEAPADPADNRAPHIQINELIDLVSREVETA
jgi:hypothetical protein